MDELEHSPSFICILKPKAHAATVEGQSAIVKRRVNFNSPKKSIWSKSPAHATKLEDQSALAKRRVNFNSPNKNVGSKSPCAIEKSEPKQQQKVDGNSNIHGELQLKLGQNEVLMEYQNNSNYFQPRHTTELLESWSPTSKNCSINKENELRKPTTVSNGQSPLLSSNLSTMPLPRRTCELLKSPWHMPKSSSTGKKKKQLLPYSARKQANADDCIEPRRTKLLLESPLHSSNFMTQTPCDALPLPRHTSELLTSPWHMPQKPKSCSTTKKNEIRKPMLGKKLLPTPTVSASSAVKMEIPATTQTHNKEHVLRRPTTCPSSKLLQQSPSATLKHTIPERKPIALRRLEFNDRTLTKTTNRITSYLKQQPGFATIANRGLQHMSAKDFVNIATHLLEFTGVLLKPVEKGHHAEQILRAMRQLNYPNNINKSWFWSPCASMSHILLLLDFLLDFVPMSPDACDDFEFETEAKRELFTAAVKEYPAWSCNMSNMSSALKQLKVEPLEEEPVAECQQSSLQLVQQLDIYIKVEPLEEAVVKSSLQIEKQLDKHMKIEPLEGAAAEHQQPSLKLKHLSLQFEQQLDTYNEHQVYKRELQDLVERIHNQGLLWRRSRKALLESIESYNMRTRDLRYSMLLGTNCPSGLELPLKPTLKQIQECGIILRDYVNKLQKEMAKEQTETKQSAL